MNTIQLIGTLFAVLGLVVFFGGFYWLIKRTK
jgi:hypothetical protein